MKNKGLMTALMFGIFSLSSVAISEFAELGESYINYSKVRPSNVYKGELVRDIKSAGYVAADTMKSAAGNDGKTYIPDEMVETMKYRDSSKGRVYVGNDGAYDKRVGNIDYVRHISNINKVKAYKLDRGEAPSTFGESVMKRLNILKWIRGKQLESNNTNIGETDKTSREVFAN
jgi:hypothetical protein